MSNDKKIQIFDFEPEEVTLFSKEFELDKNAEFVTGFLLTSDKDTMLFYRGKFKLEIGGIEYIPENFEAKLSMCGINVPPNSRVYHLGNIPVGNGKVKIYFQDTNHANAVYEPYRVSLYVHTILKTA